LGYLLDTGQNQNLALNGWKGPNFFFQPGRGLFCLSELLPIGCKILRLWGRVLREYESPNLPLSVIGTHRVSDDGKQPGMKRAVGFVLSGRAMDLDEDFLKEIIPIGVNDAAPNEVRIDRGAVPGD
jgi:hypothetical protein